MSQPDGTNYSDQVYAYSTDTSSGNWTVQPYVTALYRLFHETSRAHFYTTSAAERDNAVNQLGYQSEGTACSVYGV